MFFKVLTGLAGIITASCLWASYRDSWESLSAIRNDGGLSPSARQVYRESERLRRPESFSSPHDLALATLRPKLPGQGKFNPAGGMTPESVALTALHFPLPRQTSLPQLELTHETVPLRQDEAVRPRCRHVEVASRDDNRFQDAFRAHERAREIFVSRLGFGVSRIIQDFGGHDIPSPSDSVEHVELVSLLVHDDPGVYVVNADAQFNHGSPIERRVLDPFEELALDKVRQGAELVWSPEQPHRMFGAMRATTDCLDCHTGARENDLLGAFSYWANSPVKSLTVIALK